MSRILEKKHGVIDSIGYVKYVDHFGDDKSVVNAARVSFDKEVVEMTGKDENLIKYLIDNKHSSPLRHAGITFEICAPMMVKNQWIKHQVSSTHLETMNGWNEISRRYVKDDPQFYIPIWREAPDNMKQGSGGIITEESLVASLDSNLSEYIQHGVRMYNQAMEAGVAPEQARGFLPAYLMYIKWRWTVSLEGVLHFIKLREDNHSQWEIRRFSDPVRKIVETLYPITTKHYLNGDD